MIRTDTIEFHILPQTPVGKGTKKNEQYQLQLPTIETLRLNDQYKINGGVGAYTRVHNHAIENIHRQNLYAMRIFPSHSTFTCDKNPTP